MCEVNLEDEGGLELDLGFDAATATITIVVKITTVHTIHNQKVLSPEAILYIIIKLDCLILFIRRWI
jgi:hypothetical protein